MRYRGLRISQGWRVAVAYALAMSTGPAVAMAEVIDITRTVGVAGSVTAAATLTVTPITIATGIGATSIAFGTVTPGATPWKVAPQFLRVQYANNNANWAIRILTNNLAARPTMAGKVLDAKVIADPNDDILGYAGLIGSTPTDPNDRIALGWQVLKDPVTGGPAAPVDALATPPAPPANDCPTGTSCVGGRFNSPWAFMADASDCPSTSTNCRSATPDTVDKTIEFLRVVQGDSSTSGLLLHPDNGVRTGDGDVPVYIAARFGGAPADTFSATIIVEMYHL